MPVRVAAHVENEIAILELEGSLTLGPTLHALRDELRRVLTSSKLRGVILDATKLATADSAGLGELTVAYTLASRQSCPVVLAGAASNLTHMLKVTHLDELLPAVPDVTAGMAHLGNKQCK
jgi:anti-anti-sigma factor